MDLASRLLITWEHADLCTALELPDTEGVPAGVVVVDADRHRYVLRWHPMRMHRGAVDGEGIRKVMPEWGTGRSIDDAVLPEPVAELLAVWRARQDWSDVELVRICTALRSRGTRCGGCGVGSMEVTRDGHACWLR